MPIGVGGGREIMGVNFTPEEGTVLYGLLAENSTDIILRTDCSGNLVHGLPTMSALGLLPPAQSAARHLRDLVDPDWADAVENAHLQAIRGRGMEEWVEFLGPPTGSRRRRFAIQIRSLAEPNERVYGAISIVRSLEERRSFEEKLFAAVMTDPLTGLTNRSAFVSMLQHLVDMEVGGWVAMFDIDHFKAINMRFGHAAGDEVLIAFADLVRVVTRKQDIISRIGGESFGILMPRAEAAEAEAICRDIVETLAQSGAAASSGDMTVTASAGVARIGKSLDITITRAELAMAVAKAKGRNRVEVDSKPN